MLEVTAPDGVPEVTAGDDLVALLIPRVALADGDVVAVTSKVVSKAEGREVQGDRDEWVSAETTRTVARRGPTRIVRNRLGLTMAAAGVDGSNVAAGRSLLLPVDPDGTARSIRAAIRQRTGHNVGVIITDTAGRAWREGQTDIAIGAAGVAPLESYAGRVDAHGNELAVTAPAVADELASAAELASGKLGGRPFAVLRGRADLVLTAGEDGPGAAALIRAEGGDLFGYGAREAVVRAVAGAPADQAPFGAPASSEELVDALHRAGFPGARPAPDGGLAVPRDEGRLALITVVGFAHGWAVSATTGHADHRLQPMSP
jgi:coenzyme F420-0:L-glutamate ligase/coenzyme F420-1:gamma-L-glutamate ligase